MSIWLAGSRHLESKVVRERERRNDGYHHLRESIIHPSEGSFSRVRMAMISFFFYKDIPDSNGSGTIERKGGEEK